VNPVDKMVYMLPQSLIANTVRAFATDVTQANGHPSCSGVNANPATCGGPDTTQPYIAPSSDPSCTRIIAGDCGVRQQLLKAPVFGDVIRKATIARWTRTLATMFAAGVPLVESLDAVAGASGNAVYVAGTRKIQTQVSTGTSLTNAMHNTGLFPTMVLQMTQIGEESGSLDGMLSKVAEFFEREVDDAVAALSSLLEPIIIVFLGVVIGGLVVAMYLPIFKLGAVV
jgi:hypothetical protein